MSIHPTYQKSLAGTVAREKRIAEPIPEAVAQNLKRSSEFLKRYDSQGLSQHETIAFGPTQRTLSQFIETGWKLLEQFQLQGLGAYG